MKHHTITKLARYATLCALMTAATFCLLGEPVEGTFQLHTFVAIKAAGAILALIAGALYTRWEAAGQLPELTRLMAMGGQEDGED